MLLLPFNIRHCFLFFSFLIFKFSYISYSSTKVLPRFLSSSVCGGFFNSPEGILESPEWPKNYKGKTSCTWHVSVDPSEKIELTFKRFSLDEEGTCDKAKLVVRDGSGENSKALGVYCGTKQPPGITSSGNHLLVQFTSTERAVGKGFLISYDTGTVQNEKINCSAVFLLDIAAVFWGVTQY